MSESFVSRHRPATIVIFVAIWLSPAGAHADGAPLGRPVNWHDWNWDPVILLNLSLVLWLYCRGWSARRELAAAGESVRPILSNWRAAAFMVGMLLLLVVLISPVDALAEQLGWVHMVQHMILMTVAAPLLVCGTPALICRWGLPRVTRRSVGRFRRGPEIWCRRWTWNPLVVWTLYALVMWIWHVPAFYGAALRIQVVHDAQHVTFLIAACLFWRMLLDPVSRWKLRGGLAVFYLFTTTIHATVLGVFMTVAPTPWYAEYEGQTRLWGLTTLEDQQLAGLIMWMPACAAYAVVAVALFAKALEEPSDSASRSAMKGMVTQCDSNGLVLQQD